MLPSATPAVAEVEAFVVGAAADIPLLWPSVVGEGVDCAISREAVGSLGGCFLSTIVGCSSLGAAGEVLTVFPDVETVAPSLGSSWEGTPSRRGDFFLTILFLPRPVGEVLSGGGSVGGDGFRVAFLLP